VIFPSKPERITILDPKAVLEQENKYRLEQLRRNSGSRGVDNTSAMYSGGSVPANMVGSSPRGPIGSGGGRLGSDANLDKIAGDLSDDQKLRDISVYNFVIQFIWVETPPSERDRIKKEKKQSEEQVVNSATDTLGTDGTGTLSPDPTEVVPQENVPEEAAL
ncbi:MAG: hypothetical protein FWC43_08605, partial [Planctomycetaceae bacterium]|nr:hypothetical protein [Planctomycetaceae bacterium]